VKKLKSQNFIVSGSKVLILKKRDETKQFDNFRENPRIFALISSGKEEAESVEFETLFQN